MGRRRKDLPEVVAAIARELDLLDERDVVDALRAVVVVVNRRRPVHPLVLREGTRRDEADEDC